MSHNIHPFAKKSPCKPIRLQRTRLWELQRWVLHQRRSLLVGLQHLCPTMKHRVVRVDNFVTRNMWHINNHVRKPSVYTRNISDNHVVYPAQHLTTWWTFPPNVNRTRSNRQMKHIIQRQVPLVDYRSLNIVQQFASTSKAAICSLHVTSPHSTYPSFTTFYTSHTNISIPVLSCIEKQNRCPCPPTVINKGRTSKKRFLSCRLKKSCSKFDSTAIPGHLNRGYRSKIALLKHLFTELLHNLHQALKWNLIRKPRRRNSSFQRIGCSLCSGARLKCTLNHLLATTSPFFTSTIGAGAVAGSDITWSFLFANPVHCSEPGRSWSILLLHPDCSFSMDITNPCGNELLTLLKVSGATSWVSTWRLLPTATTWDVGPLWNFTTTSFIPFTGTSGNTMISVPLSIRKLITSARLSISLSFQV